MKKEEQTQVAQFIPWIKFLKETWAFTKNSGWFLGTFFPLFFILALPHQLDFPDWRMMTSFQLWGWVALILLYGAIAYAVSVGFLLCLKEKDIPNHQLSVRSTVNTVLELLVPLTILSVRGTLLLIINGVVIGIPGLLLFSRQQIGLYFLGLFLLPGLYFYFKYELASLCLIFEGWQEEKQPVKRAEEIISQYKFAFFFLSVLMAVEVGVPWTIEFLLETRGTPLSLAMRFGSTLLETVLTVAFNIYISRAVLFLIQRSKMQLT